MDSVQTKKKMVELRRRRMSEEGQLRLMLSQQQQLSGTSCEPRRSENNQIPTQRLIGSMAVPPNYSSSFFQSSSNSSGNSPPLTWNNTASQGGGMAYRTSQQLLPSAGRKQNTLEEGRKKNNSRMEDGAKESLDETTHRLQKALRQNPHPHTSVARECSVILQHHRHSASKWHRSEPQQIQRRRVMPKSETKQKKSNQTLDRRRGELRGNRESPRNLWEWLCQPFQQGRNSSDGRQRNGEKAKALSAVSKIENNGQQYRDPLEEVLFLTLPGHIVNIDGNENCQGKELTKAVKVHASGEKTKYHEPQPMLEKKEDASTRRWHRRQNSCSFDFDLPVHDKPLEPRTAHDDTKLHKVLISASSSLGSKSDDADSSLDVILPARSRNSSAGSQRDMSGVFRNLSSCQSMGNTESIGNDHLGVTLTLSSDSGSGLPPFSPELQIKKRIILNTSEELQQHDVQSRCCTQSLASFDDTDDGPQHSSTSVDHHSIGSNRRRTHSVQSQKELEEQNIATGCQETVMGRSRARSHSLLSVEDLEHIRQASVCDNSHEKGKGAHKTHQRGGRDTHASFSSKDSNSTLSSGLFSSSSGSSIGSLSELIEKKSSPNRIFADLGHYFPNKTGPGKTADEKNLQLPPPPPPYDDENPFISPGSAASSAGPPSHIRLDFLNSADDDLNDDGGITDGEGYNSHHSSLPNLASNCHANASSSPLPRLNSSGSVDTSETTSGTESGSQELRRNPQGTAPITGTGAPRRSVPLPPTAGRRATTESSLTSWRQRDSIKSHSTMLSDQSSYLSSDSEDSSASSFNSNDNTSNGEENSDDSSIESVLDDPLPGREEATKKHYRRKSSNASSISMSISFDEADIIAEGVSIPGPQKSGRDGEEDMGNSRIDKMIEILPVQEGKMEKHYRRSSSNASSIDMSISFDDADIADGIKSLPTANNSGILGLEHDASGPAEFLSTSIASNATGDNASVVSGSIISAVSGSVNSQGSSLRGLRCTAPVSNSPSSNGSPYNLGGSPQIRKDTPKEESSPQSYNDSLAVSNASTMATVMSPRELLLQPQLAGQHRRSTSDTLLTMDGDGSVGDMDGASLLIELPDTGLSSPRNQPETKNAPAHEREHRRHLSDLTGLVGRGSRASQSSGSALQAPSAARPAEAATCEGVHRRHRSDLPGLGRGKSASKPGREYQPDDSSDIFDSIQNPPALVRSSSSSPHRHRRHRSDLTAGRGRGEGSYRPIGGRICGRGTAIQGGRWTGSAGNKDAHVHRRSTSVDSCLHIIAEHQNVECPMANTEGRKRHSLLGGDAQTLSKSIFLDDDDNGGLSASEMRALRMTLSPLKSDEGEDTPPPSAPNSPASMKLLYLPNQDERRGTLMETNAPTTVQIAFLWGGFCGLILSAVAFFGLFAMKRPHFFEDAMNNHGMLENISGPQHNLFCHSSAWIPFWVHIYSRRSAWSLSSIYIMHLVTDVTPRRTGLMVDLGSTDSSILVGIHGGIVSVLVAELLATLFKFRPFMRHDVNERGESHFSGAAVLTAYSAACLTLDATLHFTGKPLRNTAVIYYSVASLSVLIFGLLNRGIAPDVQLISCLVLSFVAANVGLSGFPVWVGTVVFLAVLGLEFLLRFKNGSQQARGEISPSRIRQALLVTGAVALFVFNARNGLMYADGAPSGNHEDVVAHLKGKAPEGGIKPTGLYVNGGDHSAPDESFDKRHNF